MTKSMTATLKYAQSSEKKIQLPAKMIRNKDVSEAREILKHTPKKSAKIMLKVLDSAIANAKNNAGQEPEDLYVSRVEIGKGLKLRRIAFVSRAGVHPYKKHRAFVKVVLDSKN